MNNKAYETTWALEVVRGRDVGRCYALNGSSIVLGNAVAGGSGINLSDQEGSGPRRMAARQAQIDRDGSRLALRDLDSPGGTFVNRQRVLPGQARALADGDLIQLGGVQLKVVAVSAGTAAASKSKPTAPPATSRTSSAPSTPAPPAQTSPFVFPLKDGPTCRSWDDFLAVSAQRWSALRDELTSGRLAAFLMGMGRSDLAPDPAAPGSPDERLDAWLARLPTSRPSRPELDVHPSKIMVRAGGGGTTTRKLQVTNTGYRLLRSTIRVEPAEAASWLAIAPEFVRGPFVTVEETTIPIEVKIPENLDGPVTASLVLDGNGGTQRVSVAIEPPESQEARPEGVAAAAVGWDVRDWLAGQTRSRRLVGGAVGGFLARMVIGLGGGLTAGPGRLSPDLAGAALVLAALGVLGGVILALRRGSAPDVPGCGFAGAIIGVLLAALLVAVSRTVEPALVGGSTLAASLLWAALGAALAALSVWLVPDRPQDRPPS